MYINNSLIIELTTFFLLLGIFNNIEGMGVIRIISIGTLMFFGNLFLIIKVIKDQKMRKSYIKVLISYIIFLGIYFIGFIIYPKLVSIKVFLQAFSLVNFFLFFSSIDYSSCRFKIMRIGITLYIIMFILIRTGVINYTKFWRMYILYPFLMMYFLVLLYKREHKKIYIALIIALALITIHIDSRAIMLIMIITALVYLFWNSITKNKTRYILFLILVYMSIFAFMNVYISWYISPSEISMAINRFSRKTFGKNLHSGRTQMWLIVLNEIDKSPLLGYGTGVSAGNLIGRDISIHNLYLQLLVQNGILGLTSFLILLFSIWMLFWKSKDRFITRLAASFFIASIIHNTFELILLQNHMGMAFLQWFIFAIGSSVETYKSKNEDIYNLENELDYIKDI
jgi:O-antigen ligase